MMLTRMREAALPGYAKINVEQALRADKELWFQTEKLLQAQCFTLTNSLLHKRFRVVK